VSRMFMIQPIKCIILVFLIISFYSCSAVKQTGFHTPIKMAPPPPDKTVSSGKPAVKKADTTVKKKKTAPPVQTGKPAVKKADTTVKKEKTAPPVQTKADTTVTKAVQPQVNTIIKNEAENKQSNDNASPSVKQSSLKEGSGNMLMSEMI